MIYDALWFADIQVSLSKSRILMIFLLEGDSVFPRVLWVLCSTLNVYSRCILHAQEGEPNIKRQCDELSFFFLFWSLLFWKLTYGLSLYRVTFTEVSPLVEVICELIQVAGVSNMDKNTTQMRLGSRAWCGGICFHIDTMHMQTQIVYKLVLGTNLNE